MEKIDYNYIKKEEDNLKNNNEIATLKNALLSKDQLILQLQKELELNYLKNNLNSYQSHTFHKNKNSNNTLKKYDSYKNLKENIDLISSRANSMNKNIMLEDIQKQILELNIELKTKKNLLSKLKNEKNEIKSKTYSNWNINQDKIIEELKEKIGKYEEENSELKNLINSKEKKISKLTNENKSNKEDNKKLQNKINEIKKEINEITKENNKIKKEQNILNQDSM